MPRSHWGIGFATIALLAAGAGQAQSNDSKPQPQHTTPKHQHDARKTSIPAPITEHGAIAAKAQEKADWEKQRDEQNLVVQQSMAHSSSQQVELARGNNYLTAGGMALLILTLFFTGWAAVAAGRATKAMQRQNELEFRAWLDFDLTAVRIFLSEMPVMALKITIRNVGRSPATSVLWASAFTIHGVHFKHPDLTDELESLNERLRTIPRFGTTIFHGEELPASDSAKCCNPESLVACSAEAGAIWLVLALRLEYLTFGVVRKTERYFRIGRPRERPGHWLGGLNPMEVSPDVEFESLAGGKIT